MSGVAVIIRSDDRPTFGVVAHTEWCRIKQTIYFCCSSSVFLRHMPSRNRLLV